MEDKYYLNLTLENSVIAINNCDISNFNELKKSKEINTKISYQSKEGKGVFIIIDDVMFCSLLCSANIFYKDEKLESVTLDVNWDFAKSIISEQNLVEKDIFKHTLKAVLDCLKENFGEPETKAMENNEKKIQNFVFNLKNGLKVVLPIEKKDNIEILIEKQIQEEKDELVWEPEYGLMHIPDDVMERALKIVKLGLIGKLEILKEDKKIKINNYIKNACDLNKKIERKENENFITRSLKTPIKACNNPTCNKTRCVIMTAGYIKYTMDNGTFNQKMREREQYRENPENTESEIFYNWEPNDKDKFKNLPPYIYDLAEEIIKRNLVSISPYKTKDGKIYIYTKLISGCESKININSGPHDIKRALNFSETKFNDKYTESFISDNTSLGKRFLMCKECKTNLCPYRIAVYMLYLKLKGKEEEIKEAKKYSLEHPDEIYYGEDFGFSVSDTNIELFKKSIETAPADMINKAFELLDGGDAFLACDLVKGKNKDDKNSYYHINFSKEINFNATKPEDVIQAEYNNLRYFSEPGGLADYSDITIAKRFLRLVGNLDYCRRKKIDISNILNKRKENIKNFHELTGKIEGLERLYDFANSEKTSSLFCIMQGDVGSGKRKVIQTVADILGQKGKITSSTYEKLTIQQLYKQLTKETVKGFEFSGLEERKLYVLTGVDEFLLRYREFKDGNGINGISIRHVLKVLGRFSPNTYIIIVSLSKNTTNAFLNLDKRYKYTYGQNIVVFNNKTINELYEEYENDLSDSVKEQIVNREQHYKRFSEFIALNEKFLPFTNSALSHYLAEYSNVEGKPVLPPDVYDRQALINSLENMVGMTAVKEQLKSFESYITFQKKAKAENIEIKHGAMHMQFLGNPGTGKTTIARIVAKMLYDIGILEENKVVEVERKDLVGEYSGHSAPKTTQKIKEAMGGVLFIDEAYSLFLNKQDTFGKEVIATLIKAMEDYKEQFIVIFAGYDKEMQDFLKANSGIESRIGYTFHFDDYTTSELTEIFRRNMTGQNFILEENVLKKVSDVCDYYRKRKNFGNGRFVKKIEQRTIMNHAGNMGKDNWDVQIITADEIPDIEELGTLSSERKNEDIKIEQVIGLENVKEQIKKFRNKIKFEQKAKSMGTTISNGNSHMLFLGNPGTGKTMVARIITKELYEAGIIEENKLTEVERKDLVAEYIGQTAIKTSDVIEKALGGVLFIDEAYSLSGGTWGNGNKDFGHEAVETIIKAMEDHKEEFVVIFAGYKKEMQGFLEMNSGISSRIGYTFTFEDYNAEELTEIFKFKLKKNKLKYSDNAIENVKRLMQYFSSVPNFGNGRFVERIVNIAIELHSERMSKRKEIGEDFLTITVDDIPGIKYVLDYMPDGENMINPDNIKEEQNERTAIHELGHALIIKKLVPHHSIKKITISAEGNGTLGYVQHASNETGNKTKKELENIICVKMAGLAAEEVFLGEYGNGGTSDLESATNIASNMIMHYGMSKNGFVYLKNSDEDCKEEINEILKVQFKKAKEIIENNKTKIEEAKKELLKNKNITDEELSRIIDS